MTPCLYVIRCAPHLRLIAWTKEAADELAAMHSGVVIPMMTCEAHLQAMRGAEVNVSRLTDKILTADAEIKRLTDLLLTERQAHAEQCAAIFNTAFPGRAV